MNIAELSVRRPVAMTMVYILISVIAVVFIPQLGVELYPSTEMPMLSISTTYTGVGPDEVDLNVTTPIYDAIKGVSGIEEINSTSQEGQSRIMVSYAFGQDLDEAYDDLNSALANISRVLPDDADTPSIMRRDMSASPIMRLSIDGDLALNELKILPKTRYNPCWRDLKACLQSM
ncbi:MAG: efflux RND transporter permease subunit [Spirochaetales bacterium]